MKYIILLSLSVLISCGDNTEIGYKPDKQIELNRLLSSANQERIELLELRLNIIENDLEPEEEKECFESVITSTILDYISEQGWIASANIDTEVNLNLLVDQDGMISMSSLDAPDYVIEAIPNLEATLYEAINLIPQAEAGVKTNVGVLVTTSFTLPLRIFAQEEN